MSLLDTACAALGGEHRGQVSPYLCGPRCDAHAPWARSGRQERPAAPPHGIVPRRASRAAQRRTAVQDEPLAPRAPTTERGRQLVARAQGLASRAPRTVDDPYVRPGKVATSQQAAAQVLPRSGTQRRVVFDALVSAARGPSGGATDAELVKHLAMSGNTVRPRRGELVEMGLVEDSGLTRQHAGTTHTVWRPTRHAVTLIRRVES